MCGFGTPEIGQKRWRSLRWTGSATRPTVADHVASPTPLSCLRRSLFLTDFTRPNPHNCHPPPTVIPPLHSRNLSMFGQHSPWESGVCRESRPFIWEMAMAMHPVAARPRPIRQPSHIRPRPYSIPHGCSRFPYPPPTAAIGVRHDCRHPSVTARKRPSRTHAECRPMHAGFSGCVCMRMSSTQPARRG